MRVGSVVDADGEDLALECAGDEPIDEIDRVRSRDRRLHGVVGDHFEIRGSEANLERFAELPLDLVGNIGGCAHDRRDRPHLELVAEGGDAFSCAWPSATTIAREVVPIIPTWASWSTRGIASCAPAPIISSAISGWNERSASAWVAAQPPSLR